MLLSHPKSSEDSLSIIIHTSPGILLMTSDLLILCTLTDSKLHTEVHVNLRIRQGINKSKALNKTR